MCMNREGSSTEHTIRRVEDSDRQSTCSHIRRSKCICKVYIERHVPSTVLASISTIEPHLGMVVYSAKSKQESEAIGFLFGTSQVFNAAFVPKYLMNTLFMDARGGSLEHEGNLDSPLRIRLALRCCVRRQALQVESFGLALVEVIEEEVPWPVEAFPMESGADKVWARIARGNSCHIGWSGRNSRLMVRRIMLLDVRLLDFFHELRQALAHVFLLSGFQSLHVLFVVIKSEARGGVVVRMGDGGGRDGTGRRGPDLVRSSHGKCDKFRGLHLEHTPTSQCSR